MPEDARSPISVTSWAIWSLSRPLAALLIVVEIVAVAVVIIDGVSVPPIVTPTGLLTVAVLTVAGVVHTEASLGVERARRRADETPHIDLSSVWTFAAALLVPGCPATLVVLLVYLHLYLRAWRPSGFPVHRVVFSTATVVLAVHAAGAVTRAGGDEVFTTLGGLLVVGLALVAYAMVNLVLVVTAIRLSRPGSTVADAFGHRDELMLELATLAMGAAVAGAMAVFGPAYAALALPPLLVLHRTVLVRQLEEAATTDGKTGLLTATAWRLQAGHVMRAARRDDATVAVLLLDLDHFKLVNDRYGHLAGDQVLSEVGVALRAAVRDHDLVGRFGGEEFVVLLAAADGEDMGVGAAAVADRIRRRVDDLRPEVAGRDGTAVLDDVSVSVGVATFPRDGTDLERLLEVADSALYAAKESGRNAVRCGVPPHPGPTAA